MYLQLEFSVTYVVFLIVKLYSLLRGRFDCLLAGSCYCVTSPCTQRPL